MQLQWNANRDLQLHTPYSMVSFRMTLSDIYYLLISGYDL